MKTIHQLKDERARLVASRTDVTESLADLNAQKGNMFPKAYAAASLFGWDQPMRPTKAKRGQPKGNAAPIGSGPDGETCLTCEHSYCVKLGKTYHKCGLVKATCGPGTDIRLKWTACSRWQKKEASS